MKYSNVRAPKWVAIMKEINGKPEIVGRGINLMVTFEDLTEMPFLAIENDCTEHGRELYQKAINGEFGEIAEEEKEG